MLQLGGAAPLQFPVDGGNSDQEPASPRSSGGLAYAGSATGGRCAEKRHPVSA